MVDVYLSAHPCYTAVGRTERIQLIFALTIAVASVGVLAQAGWSPLKGGPWSWEIISNNCTCRLPNWLLDSRRSKKIWSMHFQNHDHVANRVQIACLVCNTYGCDNEYWKARVRALRQPRETTVTCDMWHTVKQPQRSHLQCRHDMLSCRFRLRHKFEKIRGVRLCDTAQHLRCNISTQMSLRSYVTYADLTLWMLTLTPVIFQISVYNEQDHDQSQDHNNIFD